MPNLWFEPRPRVYYMLDEDPYFLILLSLSLKFNETEMA